MKNSPMLPEGQLESLIHIVRGTKVILGPDLAHLYGVSTRVMMQSVRRNMARFPEDFAFELTRDEIRRISQNVTSLKFTKTAYAFTEHGVAMLSGVLRSPRAILVNIAVVRTFIHLRHLLDTNRELALRIDELEKKYDGQFTVVFQAIRKLMEPPKQSTKRIGY